LQVGPVFLALLDISGYTRFTRAHRTASLHAEKIIIELLESVIASSSHPLVVHELLGDEVTFYVASEATGEVAAEVRRQVAAIFEAFRAREAELISECSLCNCEACATVGKLTLKAILHFGKAVFGKVGNFTKLAGEDVILAHRLLKNSIPASEYILETDAFYQVSPPPATDQSEARIEHPEGFGPVPTHVTYPLGKELRPADVPLIRKLQQHFAIDIYALTRRLGKRRKPYANLEPPD
jgi:Protein of unknown function (DUF2652)